jgi:hypothetical protein
MPKSSLTSSFDFMSLLAKIRTHGFPTKNASFTKQFTDCFGSPLTSRARQSDLLASMLK